MNYTRRNLRCRKGTKWSGSDDAAGSGVDVNDDAKCDDGDGGSDFPLHKRIPRQISPSRRTFSLSVVSTAEAAVK